MLEFNRRKTPPTPASAATGDGLYFLPRRTNIMTARSIRRAAERKAAKLAAKEARQVSDIQLTANQENAELSTGPRTEAGKAISSMNAVKTGLTGRTVLLPSDDVAAYRTYLTVYETEFQPIGLRERELVQSIADTQWRLQRIPGLEMAIYAKGRDEFADQFNDLSPEVRNARIDLETTLHYQKPLRNLQLQESRLRRQREKDMAELKALQAERRAAELEAFAQRVFSKQSSPEKNGFVFSTPAMPANLSLQPRAASPLADQSNAA
jgi:hypothetical protein